MIQQIRPVLWQWDYLLWRYLLEIRGSVQRLPERQSAQLLSALINFQKPRRPLVAVVGVIFFRLVLALSQPWPNIHLLIQLSYALTFLYPLNILD